MVSLKDFVADITSAIVNHLGVKNTGTDRDK